MNARAFLAAVAIAATTACSGGSPGAGGTLPHAAPDSRNGADPIKHVIVMIQENRSFDDFFATFPGADGATHGKMSNGKTIALKQTTLAEPCDFGHTSQGFMRDYDGGKMDGFNLEGVNGANCSRKGQDAGKLPYQYVDPSDIQPYWDIAEQYVLADHLFQTQGSGSYTAHQDLIRGDTTIDQAQVQSLVDVPTGLPWGCDAGTGTTTPLLVWTGSELQRQKGPFPCTNQFPASGAYYETLRDLLDAKPVSWKYYTPKLQPGVGQYWNAFDTIAPVRYGSEWTTNVVSPETTIFDDIQKGALPAMSWLIPDEDNSDHPGPANDTGPSWVASVVNAVGQSPYWKSTAIVVVWDDWGGFYDHVPPAFFDHWGGLGFRVPMLVVSAYPPKGQSSGSGYISHTQYEFGSILKFVEDTFGLGRLGTTDGKRAASIGDCFDFTRRARAFVPIQSKYSRRYFEHQKPSNLPVDTE